MFMDLTHSSFSFIQILNTILKHICLQLEQAFSCKPSSRNSHEIPMAGRKVKPCICIIWSSQKGKVTLLLGVNVSTFECHNHMQAGKYHAHFLQKTTMRTFKTSRHLSLRSLHSLLCRNTRPDPQGSWRALSLVHESRQLTCPMSLYCGSCLT